jgi:hypothetical protein
MTTPEWGHHSRALCQLSSDAYCRNINCRCYCHTVPTDPESKRRRQVRGERFERIDHLARARTRYLRN